MLAALAPRLGTLTGQTSLAGVAPIAARWLSREAASNSLQVGSAAAPPAPPPLPPAPPPAACRCPRMVPCFRCSQVVLEPLDGDNEGIFFLSLCRPEARNSIGRQVSAACPIAAGCATAACAALPRFRHAQTTFPAAATLLQFLRELRECLHTVAQERTTRCVVVRSTVPGVFCAGADLKVNEASRCTASTDREPVLEQAPPMQQSPGACNNPLVLLLAVLLLHAQPQPLPLCRSVPG